MIAVSLYTEKGSPVEQHSVVFLFCGVKCWGVDVAVSLESLQLLMSNF